MVISYCCFVTASDWGAEQGWCEFVFLWHRFERRSAFFFLFFIYFSTYFKNQNIYLKKNSVKAAKSNCLSSRHVEICLRKIHSLRCRFIQNWVFLHTVLCKSNANDNRRISRFVLVIYHRYIRETSHGLPNVKMINHQDIGTIFAISRQDIVLARLHCNDISQSKMIYRHDISLQRSSL